MDFYFSDTYTATVFKYKKGLLQTACYHCPQEIGYAIWFLGKMKMKITKTTNVTL